MASKERTCFMFSSKSDKASIEEARRDANASVQLAVAALDWKTYQLEKELKREKWTRLVVECLLPSDYKALKKLQNLIVEKSMNGCGLVYYRHYSLVDGKFLSMVAKQPNTLIVTVISDSVSRATELLRLTRSELCADMGQVAATLAFDRCVNPPDQSVRLRDIACNASSGGLTESTVTNNLRDTIFLLTRKGEMVSVEPGETRTYSALMDGTYSVGTQKSERLFLAATSGGFQTRPTEVKEAISIAQATPSKEITPGEDVAKEVTPIAQATSSREITPGEDVAKEVTPIAQTTPSKEITPGEDVAKETPGQKTAPLAKAASPILYRLRLLVEGTERPTKATVAYDNGQWSPVDSFMSFQLLGHPVRIDYSKGVGGMTGDSSKLHPSRYFTSGGEWESDTLEGGAFFSIVPVAKAP
jgi:hypothetical protein